MSNSHQKTILLIIGGGIAAYKMLEFVRLCVKQNIRVIPVMTKAAKQFITPLSLASLAQEKIHDDLFNLHNEVEIGHIHLSRMADLIVIAPATADLMAKMAHGLADDMATSLLLASHQPILLAPAMNPFMWSHPATKANVQLLKTRNVHFCGPDKGEMACKEEGEGRLVEPPVLLQEALTMLESSNIHDDALKGKKILVTAGSTQEPIDDIRYIANHSSGKQGYAIASALAARGADVHLISGPTHLEPPATIKLTKVKTACQMYEASLAALPVDVAIMTAAVGDWRPEKVMKGKMKKQNSLPNLKLVENPDILKSIAMHPHHRPKLVIGFAAEAQNARENALKKYQAKGCDWLLLNDVGRNPEIFGGDDNQIHFMTKDKEEAWPMQSKQSVASKLTTKIIDYFLDDKLNG